MVVAMRSLEDVRRGTIDEFLGFWLANSLLPEAEQRVFDHYYRSYKKHFGPYVRHWYARQTKELTQLVRTQYAPRVLEVGCGCGTEALWAAIQGAEVTAIDIAEDMLAAARARLDILERDTGQHLRCDLRNASVLDLADTSPFDIMFLEQTFHHLEPRTDVVAALSRLVVPGGHVILAESNAWNPALQAVFFRMRGTKTVVHHLGHVWGNERITWPFMLVRLFRPHRLRPVGLQYYRVFPNIPVADRLRFLDRNLPGFLRPIFTHYNLVLRRDG
jgi:2-polyprenyl-3-methyl-5-hydroxy-6-metoxy-1,4-benzoquinol methylase